jgi:hypothetical protein
VLGAVDALVCASAPLAVGVAEVDWSTEGWEVGVSDAAGGGVEGDEGGTANAAEDKTMVAASNAGPDEICLKKKSRIATPHPQGRASRSGARYPVSWTLLHTLWFCPGTALGEYFRKRDKAWDHSLVGAKPYPCNDLADRG